MGSYGLQVGRADVRSAGPITFGPEGILFLADNVSAKVFAVDVGDTGPAAGSEPFDLEDVDVRVGSFLGCEADDIVIRDMAVHPDIAQRVPVGAARSRRRRPAGAGAHRPPRRLDRRRGPRRRARRRGGDRRRPRRRRRAGSTSRCPRGRRARSSRSASGPSASCAGRSARRRSPTWPTSTAPCSSPASRTRSSPRSCGASRSRSATRSIRQQPRDLPRLARQVGDGGPDPTFVPYDDGPQHPGQLHLHAGRALPPRRPRHRAPRPWAARSPSSAP